MAASNAVSGQGTSSSAVLLVLYAPDNRMLAPLSCIDGLQGIVWVDSRELDPVQLMQRHPGIQLVLLDYTGGNVDYSQRLAGVIGSLAAPPAMMGVGSIPEGPQQSTQLLNAIRSGIRDFIDLSAPMEDVQDILKRVKREIRPQISAPPAAIGNTTPDGELYVVLGVRPGIGTSTLTAHLASLIAAQGEPSSAAKEQCLLLDFGLPAGDAALYLGVEGSFHLEDALRSIGRIDSTFATSALSHHDSGLSVLARSSSAFPAEEASLLVQKLRCLYRNLLCDLGGVDPSSIPTSLLLNASQTWLVTDQSIGSLLSLDRCLQNLEQRGARDERLQLVINRYDENFGLSPDQISERFRLPVVSVIPERSRQIRSAASIGKLLHEQTSSDPYLSALKPLLQCIAPSRTVVAATSPLSRLATYISPSKWKKS